MRNVVLISVAILAFGIAVFLFVTQQGADKAVIPGEFTYQGVCLACKQEVESRFHAGDQDPFVCPKCNERAVYGWWRCDKCAKRFVPNLIRATDGEPPRVPAIPACPLCGGIETAAYLFDDSMEETVAASAPLPSWP